MTPLCACAWTEEMTRTGMILLRCEVTQSTFVLPRACNFPFTDLTSEQACEVSAPDVWLAVPKLCCCRNFLPHQICLFSRAALTSSTNLLQFGILADLLLKHSLASKLRCIGASELATRSVAWSAWRLRIEVSYSVWCPSRTAARRACDVEPEWSCCRAMVHNTAFAIQSLAGARNVMCPTPVSSPATNPKLSCICYLHQCRCIRDEGHCKEGRVQQFERVQVIWLQSEVHSL